MMRLVFSALLEGIEVLGIFPIAHLPALPAANM